MERLEVLQMLKFKMAMAGTTVVGLIMGLFSMLLGNGQAVENGVEITTSYNKEFREKNRVEEKKLEKDEKKYLQSMKDDVNKEAGVLDNKKMASLPGAVPLYLDKARDDGEDKRVKIFVDEVKIAVQETERSGEVLSKQKEEVKTVSGVKPAVAVCPGKPEVEVAKVEVKDKIGKSSDDAYNTRRKKYSTTSHLVSTTVSESNVESLMCVGNSVNKQV